MTVDSLDEKTTALFVVSLGFFLSPFSTSALNIALPSIGREFAVDAVFLGWIPASYLLATAALFLPFGKLGDILGRERFFKYGIMICTLSSLFSALSTSAVPLLLSVLLLGIGGSLIFCTGTAIVTSVFPEGERGNALGVNFAAVYLALALGPFLGGFITERFGWRSIFLTVVLLGSISTAVILRRLKDRPGHPEDRFDSPGALIYSLTIMAALYGFSQLPETFGVVLVMTSILGVMVFVGWEMRIESPLIDVRLFRDNTAFAFSNLASILFFTATFSVGFLLSLYLQYIKGFSPQVAGLAMAPQFIVQTISSPAAGRLSDRFEPRIAGSVGAVLTAFGLLLLTFLDEGTSFGLIVADLVLIGFGYALFTTPNMHAVMSSVKKENYGLASATRHTTRAIGQTLSMGLVTLIFTIQLGRVQITPEYYMSFLRGMKTALTILTLFCVGSILPSFAGGKRLRER
jgi:EmrB/QacA subfamily drug resistance transporter